MSTEPPSTSSPPAPSAPPAEESRHTAAPQADERPGSIGRLRAATQLFTDALRGRGGSPTEGPLVHAILLLAIPMVLEMVMESIFAVVDIFWVSHLGAEAVAAVALTESLMALVYTVAMGLSIGVTATVARRVGEGDPEGAALATVQGVLLGCGVAALMGGFGAWYAPDLLRVMGAEESVVAIGVGYTRVLLGLNGIILLLFLLNAAFRGAGDAAVAMRVLWLANGLNLILDPALIFGWGPFPELGVTGAAVATSIGRGTAVLVQLYTLLRLSDRLRVAWSHLRVRPAVMKRLVRLSTSATVQIFIGTASWIGLVRVVATFGSEALAGYAVAIRIVIFALLPAWGLSNAAATMVGQNLGAGQPDRAEAAVWKAARMNLWFLGSIGIAFMLLAPQIVGLFAVQGATAAWAVQGLRIMSAGFFFYAYGMVLTQSFNGAGDTWTPTWLNVICFWLWEIPLAWVLSYHAGWGPAGVFAAVAIAFSTLAVAAGFLFRRGRWRTMSV
jgi:putative MATE family efflux protein